MQHKQSVQLSRPMLRHFPMSTSVYQSKGTKLLLCIMYALIELIETENVMFHSGVLLIVWLSVTRLVRQLQTKAMSLDESQSGGWA